MARTEPLSGLRVLDFGQYIAAPGAGQNLADLGADVIKVEPPAGDQARSIGDLGTAMLQANNRAKRSIALDLRDTTGAHVARELIASADVVLHNFRPGVSERLGLDAATLLDRHPRLVYGFVTGFGTRGPSADRVGLDIAAQAEFAVMSMTGEESGDPQRVGFTVADVLAAQSLTSGVLAALVQRGTTGRGDVVETSLMEAVVHAQASTWAEFEISGVPPLRRGNGQAFAAPAADLVRTSDGGVLVVSAYTSEKFSALSELIGYPDLPRDPRFSSNPARIAHRAELLELLQSTLGQMTRDDALDRLRRARIVCGAVRRFDEIVDDPDVLASGLLADCLTQPGGVPTGRRAPTTPFSLGGKRPQISVVAPEVGAHSRQILADLGWAAEEIAVLIESGVVIAAPQADIPISPKEETA